MIMGRSYFYDFVRRDGINYINKYGEKYPFLKILFFIYLDDEKCEKKKEEIEIFDAFFKKCG